MASGTDRCNDKRWEEPDQGQMDKVRSYLLPPAVSACITDIASDHTDGGSKRWEDMDKDCLVNIFSRVPMPDLLRSVPLVCKTWHKASLDPQCWMYIDFRSSFTRRYPMSLIAESEADSIQHLLNLERPCSKYLKLAASRSQGRAAVLVLTSKPPWSFLYDQDFLAYARNDFQGSNPWSSRDPFKPEDLDFLANALKDLQQLICPRINDEINQLRLAEVINKWTALQGFSIGGYQYNLGKTLMAVSSGCPRFEDLQLHDMTVGSDAAAAMSKHLAPRLRCLSLVNLNIEKDDLLSILGACKGLRYLRIKCCEGSRNNDADVKKLGAAAQKFIYEPMEPVASSKLSYDPFENYDYDSDDGPILNLDDVFSLNPFRSY